MNKNSNPFKFKVAVLMGSTSDETVMQSCIEGLDYFGIPHEVHVMSAHRNPEAVDRFAADAEKNGFGIIIAGAGMAAHLPGAVASRTTLPVIGVPLEGSPLGGKDALYSMVQMPTGIPVATVAIGKPGARNAAVLTAEILALQSSEIKQKLLIFRQKGSKF
jgi:5-(carboxyamino)imidazole ribonucleotide mutase